MTFYVISLIYENCYHHPNINQDHVPTMCIKFYAKTTEKAGDLVIAVHA